MIGSTAIVIAALGVLAFAHSEAMLWVFTILIGAGMGISTALVTSYAADAAPQGRVGAVMGSMRMTTDLGAITGPILAGFCVDQAWLGVSGGIGLCARDDRHHRGDLLRNGEGTKRPRLSPGDRLRQRGARRRSCRAPHPVRAS